MNTEKTANRIVRSISALLGLGLLSTAYGEQDDVSKALDSTATQWSFQTAYQVLPDYHSDEVSPGVTRPAGSTDYIQLRLVAPVVFEKFTMLPRVTLRHYENAQGQSGIGNTELFA